MGDDDDFIRIAGLDLAFQRLGESLAALVQLFVSAMDTVIGGRLVVEQIGHENLSPGLRTSNVAMNAASGTDQMRWMAENRQSGARQLSAPPHPE
ncbi:hypothetical protein M798_00440 [Brucella melitensis ADMAS-G1]|nr:hypothetical protein M798_00440 [Brucella melitensis ADMAS-G1]